jgi:hypothetical protein
MLNLVAIAAMATALLTPAVVTPQAVVAPSSKVTVEVVTVNGSGCPAGTTNVTSAADNTSFTVTYSDFRAEAGAGKTALDARANCQLSLLVHIPQGFTFAIARVDYAGSASLAAGATAQQQSNYYFQGDPSTASVVHTFAGPLYGGWKASDVIPVAALVYSACGVDRGVNINTDLRVSAGTSLASTVSSMTMGSTGGSVSTVYQLAWKTC